MLNQAAYNTATMDEDAVRRWIVQAEAELADLSAQAEAIQVRLAEARRQLMLLYEMLAAVTHAPVAVAPERLGPTLSTRERVQANAEAILRDRGKPMRIQDIHAEFIRRRMPLPGRGSPTNIVAHMVASPQFSRKVRGVYGLAEWDRPSHSDQPSSPATSVAVETTETPRALSQRDRAHSS